jgi:hypothetical protein
VRSAENIVSARLSWSSVVRGLFGFDYAARTNVLKVLLAILVAAEVLGLWLRNGDVVCSR